MVLAASDEMLLKLDKKNLPASAGPAGLAGSWRTVDVTQIGCTRWLVPNKGPQTQKDTHKQRLSFSLMTSLPSIFRAFTITTDITDIITTTITFITTTTFIDDQRCDKRQNQTMTTFMAIATVTTNIAHTINQHDCQNHAMLRRRSRERSRPQLHTDSRGHHCCSEGGMCAAREGSTECRLEAGALGRIVHVRCGMLDVQIVKMHKSGKMEMSNL